MARAAAPTCGGAADGFATVGAAPAKTPHAARAAARKADMADGGRYGRGKLTMCACVEYARAWMSTLGGGVSFWAQTETQSGLWSNNEPPRRTVRWKPTAAALPPPPFRPAVYRPNRNPVRCKAHPPSDEFTDPRRAQPGPSASPVLFWALFSPHDAPPPPAWTLAGRTGCSSSPAPQRRRRRCRTRCASWPAWPRWAAS